MDASTQHDTALLENGAIDELRRLHESDLRGFVIRRYGVDEAAASRIVEKSFQALAERPDDFPTPVRAGLFSMAANAAIASKRLPDDDDEFDPADGYRELVERFGPLRQRLGSLPPGERAAVALVYVAGLSFREAASKFGISTGCLKTRLRRSLGKLARATLEA